jgi:hypothetical protein
MGKSHLGLGDFPQETTGEEVSFKLLAIDTPIGWLLTALLQA